MGGRLRANIALRNPDTGVVECFTAGSTVPPWAAERITNPDVWASDGPDVGEVPAPTPDSETDTDTDVVEDEIEPQEAPVATDGDDEDLDAEPDGVPARPPLAGKGSSRAAWAAYARSLGIQVDDDMGRDDIVDAVDDELLSRGAED